MSMSYMYDPDPYDDLPYYGEEPDYDVSDDNWALGTLNIEDNCW
jgi:hypothetical protein